MLSPFNALLIIANNVSKIGIAKIRSGIIIEVIVTFLNPKSAIIAIINPKNIEPLSPINILAGLKLYTRNPKVDPSIINVNTKSSPADPPIVAIIPIVKK